MGPLPVRCLSRGDFVRVAPTPDGGRIRHGWRLREWPDILLTAVRHAVWEEPDGTLVDITPDCLEGSVSLFALADTAALSGARYRILYHGPDHAREIEAKIAAMKGGQRIYEERRAAKAGQSLHEWMATKFFIDPVPDAIADFMRAFDQLIARQTEMPDLIELQPDDYDDTTQGEWQTEWETFKGQDMLEDVHLALELSVRDIEAGLRARGLKATGLTQARVSA